MSSTAKPLVAFVLPNMPLLSSHLPRLPDELGDVSPQVLVDRLTYPLLCQVIGHPIATEQHLLVAQRQAGNFPTHGQALEEQLGTPPPGVVLARRRSRRPLSQLLDRAGTERLAQGQLVALRVGVVDGR